MGPMRVLVTGFGPFPGVTLNPSEAAVDALQRRADTGRMPGLQVGTAVLPVDFKTIPGQIAEIMRLVRPQLVLCTGVDMGAEAITVERVAINLLDARVPDIKGAQHLRDRAGGRRPGVCRARDRYRRGRRRARLSPRRPDASRAGSAGAQPSSRTHSRATATDPMVSPASSCTTANVIVM